MVQPPYPQFNGKLDCVDGNPIGGMEEDWDQIHPVMMQIGKAPVMDGGKVVEGMTYQTAGEIVCVVTGLGSTIRKARERCYGVIDKVKFSDAFWRTDIGEKVEKPLPKLREAGYALQLEW
jgi:hypothetical protein